MQVQVLKPVLFIFGVLLPAWITYRLTVNRQHRLKGKTSDFKKEALLALFILYLSIVAELTIMPAAISGFNNLPEPAFNVIPVINTYRQFVGTLAEADPTDKDLALENIIGNVLLFLPMGILLPALFARFRPFKKLAFACFLCSVSIELIQFILRQFGTYRTVDIDDVILNTTGGVLGWLIFTKIISKYFFRDNY